MENRAVIEQAKGIIMGARHCSAEDTFALLVKVSLAHNQKVRHVAAALVDRAAYTPPGGLALNDPGSNRASA